MLYNTTILLQAVTIWSLCLLIHLSAKSETLWFLNSTRAFKVVHMATKSLYLFTILTMTTVNVITSLLTVHLKLCRYRSDYSEDPGFHKSMVGSSGPAIYLYYQTWDWVCCQQGLSNRVCNLTGQLLNRSFNIIKVQLILALFFNLALLSCLSDCMSDLGYLTWVTESLIPVSVSQLCIFSLFSESFILNMFLFKSWWLKSETSLFEGTALYSKRQTQACSRLSPWVRGGVIEYMIVSSFLYFSFCNEVFIRLGQPSSSKLVWRETKIISQSLS